MRYGGLRSAARFARAVAALALVLIPCTGAACRGASASERSGARAHADPAPADFDVEHYALDLALDPRGRSVEGRTTIRFFARVDGLDRIVLDFTDLEVSAVHDGDGRALAFARADDKLDVRLAEPLRASECAEVTVAYAGTPRRGLWFVGHPDAPARHVFTHGQCEDARGWFPCADRTDERATSEILVRMPRAWIALAAGERVERAEEGELAIERWRMRDPHPAYLTTLVAGELALATAEWDALPLAFLCEPRYADLLVPTFAETGDILDFLSSSTGLRYPYAKYGQACVENLPARGMENVSATTLEARALQDERARRDAPSTSLLVHEAAHQWFGDLVTCRTWTDVWLHEGLATYFESLYAEHAGGADALCEDVLMKQAIYVRAAAGPNRRAIVRTDWRDPSELFEGGLVYEGAAVRLHLLRNVVGDRAFFEGLRSFVARHARSSATTDDFRAALESAAATELSWFFDAWFRRPGFPEFQVAWTHDARAKKVTLAVAQTQDTADGTPSVFRTPVDVEVCDASGSRTHRLWIERRRQVYELPAETAPRWVRFDSGGWIPKRCDEEKSLSEWMAIAEECSDVAGRHEATTALARALWLRGYERERALVSASLARVLERDRSSVVRAGAAAGLFADRSDASRRALMRAGATDADAGVRARSLVALTASGTDAELAAFALQQYRAAFSWDAQAASARLYAVAAPDDARAFLEAELQVDTPHDELRSRLIPIFARLAGASAIEWLERVAQDERAEEASRVAAVVELGSLGRGKRSVRRSLVDLVDTPSFRLRRAVFHALGSLRDDAAVLALRDRHRDTPFDAERRAIEALWSRSLDRR